MLDIKTPVTDCINTGYCNFIVCTKLAFIHDNFTIQLSDSTTQLDVATFLYPDYVNYSTSDFGAKRIGEHRKLRQVR